METHPKIPCTVEILTLNSGATLERALQSVQDFSDILVLDGNSTDDTVAIAHKYGARVIPQVESEEKNIRIQDFATIRNKGLQLARFKWVLCMDSDEYLSQEAGGEIQSIVNQPLGEFGIYRLPRVYTLNGEVIERASVYPSYQNRLFHLDAVFGFAKKVHENIKAKPETKKGTLKFPQYVPLDPIEVLKSKTKVYLDIQQESLKDLSFTRLYKGLWSNSKKFVSYCVRYSLLFFRGRGKRLPFWYEYYTATYHLRLMWRLCVNFVRKKRS